MSGATKETQIRFAFDPATRIAEWVVPGAKDGAIKLDTKRMTDADRDKAFVFGINQKVSNAAAKSRVLKGGVEVNATPDNKRRSMYLVVESLESGRGWNPGRDPDRIGVDESLLSQAMVLAFPGKTAEEIRAKVVGSTAQQRRALTEDARIKPYYDKLVEELTADVDTEELLAGW